MIALARYALSTLLLATSLTAAGAAAAAAQDALPTARSDRYTVEWGSVSLGEGVITVTPKGNGCFEYLSTTDPIAVVRWTYGKPTETSEFCVRDGKVQAQRFAYRNDKRSKDSFSLDFDWQSRRAKLIHGGDVTEIKLEDGTTDRFSIREAVRLWVIGVGGKTGAEQDFSFIDDDDLRHYRFAIKGTETVKTAAGSFETIRVERIDNPKKSYRYWLAPTRDYAPVKIEHINKGKVELRMSLLPQK